MVTMQWTLVEVRPDKASGERDWECTKEHSVGMIHLLSKRGVCVCVVLSKRGVKCLQGGVLETVECLCWSCGNVERLPLRSHSLERNYQRKKISQKPEKHLTAPNSILEAHQVSQRHNRCHEPPGRRRQQRAAEPVQCSSRNGVQCSQPVRYNVAAAR